MSLKMGIFLVRVPYTLIEFFPVGVFWYVPNRDVWPISNEAQGAPKQFRKVWLHWVDSTDTLKGEVDI